MNEIRLAAVTKRFDDTVALDQVSLCIRRGEFFSLLGGSGCGKTTTLRLIAGFEDPTEGEVFFDDRRMNGVPPNRRDTAMVFQNYALFPHLSVERNVAFGLEAHGVPRAEARRRVAEALRLVELEGLEKRAPHELSGGQQQRVAVARAAVVRPEALLLDEPLSNLDARLRKSTRRALKRVQGALDAAAVYVTHDQEEALALSDRVAVMREGRIEQIGSPREVYEAPANPFVARFVGESNVWQARWRRGESGPWRLILASGGEFAADPAALLDFEKRHGAPEDGQPALVAVKPEDAWLALDSEAAALQLDVESIEYGGASVSIWGKTGEELAQVRPRRIDGRVCAGDRAPVAFDAARARLFAAET